MHLLRDPPHFNQPENYVKPISIVAAVLFAFAAAATCAQVTGDKPVVVRMDPALDALVSPAAKLEVVKTGFGFTEGITWVDKGGYLLLSDIPANVIYRMTPNGETAIHLYRAGYGKPDIWRAGAEQTNGKNPADPQFEKFFMTGSDGLALDPQGRLIIATYSGRSIDRLEENGSRTVLADSFEGQKLNGPNDVVVKKNGTIYFSETFGGLRLRDKDPGKGLQYQGLFMIRDGKVSLVAKDIATPNGLTLSPDEKYLYANGGGMKYVRRYRVQPDDTLTDSQMLIDLSADPAPGITDGMKVDSQGNIYESGPGGIWIISPQGKHLGTILVPELVANLVFGDADRKTLYIAARTSVYRIRVNTAGLP
jgi:gluconolactonase